MNSPSWAIFKIIMAVCFDLPHVDWLSCDSGSTYGHKTSREISKLFSNSVGWKRSGKIYTSWVDNLLCVVVVMSGVCSMYLRILG